MIQLNKASLMSMTFHVTSMWHRTRHVLQITNHCMKGFRNSSKRPRYGWSHCAHSILMMVSVSKGGLEPSTAGRGTENFFLNLFSLNVSIFRRRKTLKKRPCMCARLEARTANLQIWKGRAMRLRHQDIWFIHDKFSYSNLRAWRHHFPR